MFKYILLSIMCILFGIVLIARAVVIKNGRKIGNYKLYDGIITSVNPDTRNIDVAYTVGETSYLFSYNMLEFQDMPAVDLQVGVITYAKNPQIVFTVQFKREMGRGTSGKYIDNNSLKTRKKSILFGIALIVNGIFYLLIRLNII